MSDRITRLNISDFRSIKGSHSVDLDAPIVLIHGRNGSGKTSLMSAIELGLTGKISSLERIQTDYLNSLVHFGSGTAAVSVQRGDSAENANQLTVRDGKCKGAPLLHDEDAKFFKERCFLSQATLNRLFDYYDERKKDQSNTLANFVKEVLGLDEIDAVIDGLSKLQNITSIRRVLPELKEVEAKEKSLLALLEKLREIETNLLEKFNTEIQAIRTFTSWNIGDAPPDDVITTAIDTASIDKEEKELIQVRNELSVAMDHLTVQDSSADRTLTIEQSLRERRTLLAAWENDEKPKLNHVIAEARKSGIDLPLPQSNNFLPLLESAKHQTENQLERINATLAQQTELSESIAELSEEKEKVQARLNRIKNNISTLAENAGEFAATLSQLQAHIEGEVCPVCDRDFSEENDHTLKHHLIEKISALTTSANELAELGSSKANAEATLLRIGHQIDDKTELKIPSEQLFQRRRLGARLSELLPQIERIRPIAENGAALELRFNEAQNQYQNWEKSNTQTALALKTLSEIETKLRMPDHNAQQGRERALECLKLIEEKIEKCGLARTSIQQLSRDYDRLKKLNNEYQYSRAQSGEIDKSIKSIEEAKAKFNSLREAGKNLRTHAERIRSEALTNLLSGRLNNIWQQLFIRLAPTEPFIPKFVASTLRNRDIEIKTAPRGGQDGAELGHPRMMLSAGNLNTAALTLFTSLHLSMPTQLPWLFIDDPVQGMDEIHTTQFAALLRTLSRNMGKQIIIAVHEKALFDYLSLELSPASQNDRLITIEVSKRNDGATDIDQKIKTWRDEEVLREPLTA